jgi:RNA polymerase sigma factor (sigma-70 family)
VVSDLPPFQTLIDQHAADLRRFLVAMAGPADGADAFQETWLAALRAYPALRSGENLRGWLFTIAHRKVIDLARSRSRQAEPVAEPPEVAHRDPDHLASHDAGLWAAVASLPPKQRSAVVQRHVLDRPYAEVAQVLDSSQDAARQSVRAGLRRLRELLPDPPPGGSAGDSDVGSSHDGWSAATEAGADAATSGDVAAEEVRS